MIYLGAIILVLAVVAFVGYPLVRQRREEGTTESDETLDILQSKRDTIYAAITELRSDYELGNLSPEDHRDLEEKYKQKAAVVLQQIDSADSGSGGEDEIEREIIRLRRKQRVMAELSCPRCGGKNPASAKFCSHCGAALSRRCPQCGTDYSSQDRFCSQCGAELSSREKSGK